MAYNANSQFHFDANLPSDSTQWLIVEPVYQAVMQRRRAPNTKSSESKLCAIFGVGCMHMRRALLLLAAEGIVNLQSNRRGLCGIPRCGGSQ